MNIYLAATSNVKAAFLDGRIDPTELNVLESFYTIQPWQTPLIPQFNDFLLDSGAFTLLGAKKGEKIDFDEYADRYAQFIAENHVTKYFELDLDGIVGLDGTERLRERIEKITGIPSIPVWHRNRGKQYFIDMCQQYPYVALGGLALREIPMSKFEPMFPWFINTAHKYGAKIHGLGFTNVNKLPKYHFDSVDSTTWNNGGRFGELDEYAHGTILIHRSVHNGEKYRHLKDPQAVNVHNLHEWIKFIKYAKLHL